MRIHLHLAALLAITAAATTHAQVTSPDKLIAPPPRPPAVRHPAVTGPNVQWLWQYTTPYNGHPVALARDARFPILLRDTLKAPQSFWRDGSVPLHQVALRFFDQPLSLNSADNRYITLTGNVGDNPFEQGLLWVDTVVPHPTVVFIAKDWTTVAHPLNDPNADYNLWVFTSRPLDANHLPSSLVETISAWALAMPQTIHTAIVVDPDGTPHKVDPSTLGILPRAEIPGTPTPASPAPKKADPK